MYKEDLRTEADMSTATLVNLRRNQIVSVVKEETKRGVGKIKS